MSRKASPALWSVFIGGALAGYAASGWLTPQPVSAAPENARGLAQNLNALESQLAELQSSTSTLQQQVNKLQTQLKDLDRTSDGRFVFRAPVDIDPGDGGTALQVLGKTHLGVATLPATEPTLMVSGKAVFKNGDQSEEPAIEVAGLLRGDDVRATLVESDGIRCDVLEAVDASSHSIVADRTMLRIVECDVLICSDTARFERAVVVERDATLRVDGILDARGAEVRLPPTDGGVLQD